MFECLPKIHGVDAELANWHEAAGDRDGHPQAVTRRLLRELPGYPHDEFGGTTIEWGRRFFDQDGSSAYEDSSHLEINTAEELHASRHVARYYALLRKVDHAASAINEELQGHGRVRVGAFLTDLQESWGHHLNILTSRSRFYDPMFGRKPHLLGWLATHLATATIFAGQGGVGASHGRAACDRQLSQRADWFETLVGEQTMFDRPLVNRRDEPHANRDEFARLHIIFFDNALCPTARYLMVGTTQLICAMGEAGWIDLRLLLDDPLVSAFDVSRDLSLRQPLRLVGTGRSATAAEVQAALAELAGQFVASGAADDAVPGAAEIVACWRETVELVQQRDLDALARRCDWAAKFLLLDRYRGRHGLTWQSPELRWLDQQFSLLDPDEGLFWKLARAGQIERMPSEAEIQRAAAEPPESTRAFLRAHLLRRYGTLVHTMDWDRIRFRVKTDRYWWTDTTVSLPDPTRFGRAEAEPLLDQCRSLRELVEALGDHEPDRQPSGSKSAGSSLGSFRVNTH